MKYCYIIILIFSISLFNSCKNSKLEKCNLSLFGKYSLPLPKETALANIEKITINKIGDSLFISFLDNRSRTIFIYSFIDKKLINSVKIQSKLFNIKYSSYLIHNLDSIFLLDYKNSDLYLINSHGVTKNIIKIRSEKLISENKKNNNFFIPFPTDGLNSNGFIFFNKMIYISSSGNESINFSKNCKDIFKIDIDKNESFLVFDKPKKYYIGFWGDNFCHNIQFVFNPNTQSFIIGYGIDHFVYETDFKSFKIAHLMNSKSLKRIKPFSKNKPEKFIFDDVKNDIEKYDFLNGYYFDLFYDSSQKKYYRFLNLPVKNKDYIESMKTGVFEQKLAIVISDENFNILYDKELIEINKCPIFINNGNFYFLDRESYRINSDSLYLNIYKIKL